MRHQTAGLENAELENAAPNCRTGKRETGKRENGLVMESRSILNNRHTSRCYFNTPFTRYSRLYNRFDNRLYRVNKHPTGCQSGCQKGLTTGLTTVLNERPLFVQPVDKRGLTTVLNEQTVRDSRFLHVIESYMEFTFMQ